MVASPPPAIAGERNRSFTPPAQLEVAPTIVPAMPFQEPRFAEETRQLTTMLRGSNAPVMTYSESPLFNLTAGREFLGTSQMPGQPSKRTKLAIGQIRDAGTHLTARMSLVENSHVQQSFTGFIENDQLVLLPKKKNTKMGMAMSRHPWHSKLPTRITLHFNGKELAGTSKCGERFLFLPREETVIETEPASFTPQHNGDSLRWQITRRNGAAVHGQHAHIWRFRKTGNAKGNFVWHVGSQLKESGTYVEDQPEPDHLNLTLNSKHSPKTYQLLVVPNDRDSQMVSVCIGKHGAGRPPRLDPEFGNVFDLLLVNQ